MRHALQRFVHSGWFSVAIGIIALCAVGYGAWRYVTLTKEYDRLYSVAQKLRDTAHELESNLALTEYERERLAGILNETELTIGTLQQETETLNEKVGDFEKLSSLDPELLKKYSKVYFLNEHYEPTGLVPIDPLYVNGADRELLIHERVAPFLHNLLEEAAQEELELLVTSAYRSFGTQAALKSQYKIIYGAGTANQFSADQGYSEHQLGTTVDFTTKKMRALAQSFDTTPEYKWLSENAHRFGFVLSYPKGNKYYIYEPWHWRFVGVGLATMLHETKETLYNIEQRTIDEYLIGIFD